MALSPINELLKSEVLNNNIPEVQRILNNPHYVIDTKEDFEALISLAAEYVTTALADRMFYSFYDAKSPRKMELELDYLGDKLSSKSIVIGCRYALNTKDAVLLEKALNHGKNALTDFDLTDVFYNAVYKNPESIGVILDKASERISDATFISALNNMKSQGNHAVIETMMAYSKGRDLPDTVKEPTDVEPSNLVPTDVPPTHEDM